MIENEIAKFEKPLQLRFELLLVAELGEPLLVAIVDPAPRGGRHPPSSRKGLAADPLAQRPYAASRTEVNRRTVGSRYDRRSESRRCGGRDQSRVRRRTAGRTDGRYGGIGAGDSGASRRRSAGRATRCTR